MDGFGNNFQIKVSTDILRAKADVVTGKVSEMEGGLNEMKQVVMRTANYWIGEGGDARRNSYINQQAFVEERHFGSQHVAQEQGRRQDAKLDQPLPSFRSVKSHHRNVKYHIIMV